MNLGPKQLKINTQVVNRITSLYHLLPQNHTDLSTHFFCKLRIGRSGYSDRRSDGACRLWEEPGEGLHGDGSRRRVVHAAEFVKE